MAWAFAVSHDRQDRDCGRDRSHILGVLAHVKIQVHKLLQQNFQDGYILIVVEHCVTSVQGVRLFRNNTELQKCVQRVLDDIFMDTWGNQTGLCAGLFCTGVDSKDNPPGRTGQERRAPRWR